MSKFNKKKGAGDVPAVNTASLPDIVFMLLFFFMTVTVMKDSTVKVENQLPNANEIKKVGKKGQGNHHLCGCAHQGVPEGFWNRTQNSIK